jgi:hypothetical protein
MVPLMYSIVITFLIRGCKERLWTVGILVRVVPAPQCGIRVASALPPPWLREKPKASLNNDSLSVLLPVI